MRKQYLTYDGPDASERVSDIFRFLNQEEMSATESCCFSKGDVSFYTISCEKYYFRVGSNLTITLSLFVKENHIDACLFVGGGGSGLLGWTMGAERNAEKIWNGNSSNLDFIKTKRKEMPKGISFRFLFFFIFLFDFESQLKCKQRDLALIIQAAFSRKASGLPARVIQVISRIKELEEIASAKIAQRLHSGAFHLDTDCTLRLSALNLFSCFPIAGIGRPGSPLYIWITKLI